ncbi:Protein of unknown function [Gryllus bimaculatus]|nr:Protein of unknown function [Gryllus bimaculatus]
MKASVKLPVFVLACFFSLALCTPTCKAKPNPEVAAREQWRERWTSKSTEAAASSGTTSDGDDPVSPMVGPVPDETVATPTSVVDEAKPEPEDAGKAKSAAEESSGANETTAVDEAVVTEEVPAKEEGPTTEKSKSSESSVDKTNTSSDASSKGESSEASVVLPGDVTSTAFSSAFSAYSSAQSESSESDGLYVSCEAAGGTPSNIKTLRFCYFENDTVEICACPLRIFNDFELELDDIYKPKYTHYFEDNACYFKKQSH